MNFKLVKDHIKSYVMSTISIKTTNPIELEKLCLLKSKIAEIELLFKMTENDYRKFVSLLFVSDNFLKEVTDFSVFNYPITTQECMLSVDCEKTSSKISKNSSSTPKSQSNEYFLSVKCDKSPPLNDSSNFKNSSSTPNSKSNEFT